MSDYQTTKENAVQGEYGAARRPIQRMGQSRIASFIESLANVGIGFGVALLTQVLVFPLFGLEVNLNQNLAIGAIFTAVSIARSYCVRRAFNWFHGRR